MLTDVSPTNEVRRNSKRSVSVADEEEKVIPRDGLTNIHLAAYSVGHFCNDLCAAMWFVYLSWYLNKVVNLDERTTAYCLLSG